MLRATRAPHPRIAALKSPGWSSSVAAWLVLLAAGCGSPVGCGVELETPREAAGAPLRGIAPAGDVTLPLLFRWEGGAPDRPVRLAIVDRAERQIFSFDARGQQARAPEGLEKVLEPGEAFYWTVSIVDEDDRAAATSPPVGFRVAAGT